MRQCWHVVLLLLVELLLLQLLLVGMRIGKVSCVQARVLVLAIEVVRVVGVYLVDHRLVTNLWRVEVDHRLRHHSRACKAGRVQLGA